MYAGAALIGVLAAAVAIPVFALGQGSGGGTVVAPNSVAIIDPESNSVTGSIPVGIRPSSVAVGEGSVWVGNLDDRTLSQNRSGDSHSSGDIGLDRTRPREWRPERAPSGSRTGPRLVLSLRPVSTAVVETIDDVTSRSSAGSAAFGLGAVWFAFGVGEIVKVNPSTNVPGLHPESWETAPRPSPSMQSWVWVANAGANTLSQVNPRTVSEVKPSRSAGARARSPSARRGLGRQQG